MSGLFTVVAAPIIPGNASSFGSIRAEASTLIASQNPVANYTGTTLSRVQDILDKLLGVLSKPLPQPTEFGVTDQNGVLIAWIGNRAVAGRQYFGAWFRQLYVGGTDPTTAPLFADQSGNVIIGQNGSVSISDPFGNLGAWLGARAEAPKNIVGMANSGSGSIRVAVTAHGYVSGDQVSIADVTGTVEGNGQWIIVVFDVNHFDLVGSTFVHAWAGAGTATRFFAGGLFSSIALGAAQPITNVVNNGAGLCRVTVIGHGYSTGYQVTVTGVVGVPSANNYWLVTVIDADHFDLIGSVFAGTYVSGGLALNWPTAKFIARDDGSVAIRNATISLDGTNATITLDPVLGEISIIGKGGLSAVNTFLSASTVGGILSGLLMVDPANPTTSFLTAGYSRIGLFNIIGGTDTNISPGEILVESAAGINITSILGTGIVTPSLTLTGTPLGLGSGGTGGSTATAARTNLSVYSKAETDAAIAAAIAGLGATFASHGTYGVAGGGGGSVTI